MRFTIERLRTIVLVAGVLLVAALGVFLALGKWKNAIRNRDLPKRLGIDITQEQEGVTYTQSRGGHTLFKIHASKVVQLKNEHALLHDVDIELYGPDGARTDRIAGKEFEYDQQTQVAKATGPVEITMVRPATARSATASQAASQAKSGAQAAPVPRPTLPVAVPAAPKPRMVEVILGTKRTETQFEPREVRP